jgi:hypothetical protein
MRRRETEFIIKPARELQGDYYVEHLDLRDEIILARAIKEDAAHWMHCHSCGSDFPDILQNGNLPLHLPCSSNTGDIPF